MVDAARRRRGSSQRGRGTTFEESKYFQDFIFLAAESSAKMSVFAPFGGSCLSVCLWQWSVLSWLIKMMSGSGSSCREDTQEGVLRVEMENLECHILEGPESHGSTSIVKLFGC